MKLNPLAVHLPRLQGSPKANVMNSKAYAGVGFYLQLSKEITPNIGKPSAISLALH